MALKSYRELSAIDVSPYCKTRDAKDESGKKVQIPYLPWAVCKRLLHENGAETVYFEPVINESGSSLIQTSTEFKNDKGRVNRCYEVRVRIVIDDLIFEYQTPLLNGNLVVYEDTLNQLRVNNALARAFVKGVAVRTGLGISLWEDDEPADNGNDDLSGHNLLLIKQRIEKLITAKMGKGLTAKDIANKTGMTEKQVAGCLNALVTIYKMEKEIEKL